MYINNSGYDKTDFTAENSAPVTKNIKFTNEEDKKSYIKDACSFKQQQINSGYKYLTEYKLSCEDPLDRKTGSAIVKNKYESLEDIFAKKPALFTQILYLDKTNTPSFESFTYYKNSCIHVFLQLMFEQNKLVLIPDDLQEECFVYACKNLNQDYALAVINLYRCSRKFFDPSWVKTLYNLDRNTDILKAINATATTEDIISSKKIFNLNHCRKQKNIYKALDFLDLETQSLETQLEKIFTKVRCAICKLNSIAIHINIVCYLDPQGESFFSFGDENACINILNQLIFLGLKKINLYLNPPDSSGICDRKRFTADNWEQYKIKKQFVIKKLSYLLNGIDGNARLPQTLMKDGCIINIKFINEQHTHKINFPTVAESTTAIAETNYEDWLTNSIPDSLVLSFAGYDLDQQTKNLNNILTLRPFLFKKKHESIIISKSIGSIKIPLNNPLYAILKEQEHVLPVEYSGKDAYKNWIYNLLIKNEPKVNDNLLYELPIQNKSKCSVKTLTEIINTTLIGVQEKTIHHGIVYGLHRPEVKFNAGDILDHWITALNNIAITEKKPVVLSIVANSSNIDKQQFAINNSLVIDLCKADYDIKKLTSAFKQTNTIIIFYPSLPKLIFNYLIDNTTIPILVEGANTTSYALETGTPYLSIAPMGETAIPAKMGDPWQAFLMEALSYKLAINCVYLNTISKLFNYVINNKYKEAIDLINIFPVDFKELSFLQRNKPDNSLLGTTQITILSLLEKGNSLSTMGRNYLLQALDPGIANTIHFIKQCMLPNSKQSMHFKMMQHHVNLEINDNLIISLYKLFNQISLVNNY